MTENQWLTKLANGTGKRPVRHVVGCWCVELLKGAMQ